MQGSSPWGIGEPSILGAWPGGLVSLEAEEGSRWACVSVRGAVTVGGISRLHPGRRQAECPFGRANDAVHVHWSCCRSHLHVLLYTEFTAATAALRDRQGRLGSTSSELGLSNRQTLLPPPRWEGAAQAPGKGKSPRAIRPNPGLSLRLEMAAAEPGSSGTPARRPRLLSASPVLPRDSDPWVLAQPAESWGPRGPGTPAPAQPRETVLTQVQPLGVEGEKLTGVVG